MVLLVVLSLRIVHFLDFSLVLLTLTLLRQSPAAFLLSLAGRSPLLRTHPPNRPSSSQPIVMSQHSDALSANKRTKVARVKSANGSSSSSSHHHRSTPPLQSTTRSQNLKETHPKLKEKDAVQIGRAKLDRIPSASIFSTRYSSPTQYSARVSGTPFEFQLSPP